LSSVQLVDSFTYFGCSVWNGHVNLLRKNSFSINDKRYHNQEGTCERRTWLFDVFADPLGTYINILIATF
jgi:hypothetical protein